MRRRRIFFYLLVIVLLSLIVKIISSIVSRPEEDNASLGAVNYYVSNIFREKRDIVIPKEKIQRTEQEKLFEVYETLPHIRPRLVPNSNHMVSANEYAYNAKEIRQYIRGEREYDGNEKLVFLTFDDGPNTVVTPQILNILRQNDARATFFVQGKLIVEENYPVLKRMLAEGNSIALHSFSHEYEDLYPDKKADTEKILEEARLSQGRLKKVFGEDFSSNVWRYPGGHMSWQEIDDADAKLAKMGVEWIDWNSMSGDATRKSERPTTPEGMRDTIVETLNQNLHTEVAVVLMHDSKEKQLTADSLQMIIDYFKENNYKFCILQ